MKTLRDIYMTAGRKTHRYEFSLLESSYRRLQRLSEHYQRSVPDIIAEGISIVLLAYEHEHPEWERPVDEKETTP